MSRFVSDPIMQEFSGCYWSQSFCCLPSLDYSIRRQVNFSEILCIYSSKLLFRHLFQNTSVSIRRQRKSGVTSRPILLGSFLVRQRAMFLRRLADLFSQISSGVKSSWIIQARIKSIDSQGSVSLHSWVASCCMVFVGLSYHLHQRMWSFECWSVVVYIGNWHCVAVIYRFVALALVFQFFERSGISQNSQSGRVRIC